MYSIKDMKLEDIQLGIEAENWEDAIRKAAVVPVERGMIKQDYVEAMIRSVNEYGPYIVLSENIALAHARPEDGAIETGLYFTTLAHPIEFGAEDFDPVKLLIVLSAKDGDGHIGLLCELSGILETEGVLEALINAKTAEEFRGILVRTVNEIQ